MNRRKFLAKMTRYAFIIEALISILLLLGILISIPDIVRYYVDIIRSGREISYDIFRQFLSHILLLVVAIEFILLMIAHEDATIIHLISLVIARKLLVYSDNMRDLLIGVIAIFILFAARKYFIGSSKVMESKYLFSASKTIESINNKYNLDIPTESEKTLGGYVAHLLDDKGMSKDIGTLVDDGKYLYEVHEEHKGVLLQISIDEI